MSMLSELYRPSLALLTDFYQLTMAYAWWRNGLHHREARQRMMPDGHGGIELSRFLTPPVVADHRIAPVNALGYLRVMFAVDDLDDTLARLRKHDAQLVDEVVQYEDVYRLCYVRGPEGILIGLAEQIG